MAYCYTTKDKQYRIVIDDLAGYTDTVKKSDNLWDVTIFHIGGEVGYYSSVEHHLFKSKKEARNWAVKHYGLLKSRKTRDTYTENWKGYKRNGVRGHEFPGLGVVNHW